MVHSVSGRLVHGLRTLYWPSYPLVLVNALQRVNFRGWAFLGWYWQTTDFSLARHQAARRRLAAERLLLAILVVGIVSEIGIGGVYIFLGLHGLSGGVSIGVALLVAYPLVWANLIGFGLVLASLLNVKQTGLAVLCLILESQVRALRRRHNFTLVAVAGSVGKTSSKLAIAEVLAGQQRVAFQDGNNNTRLTVPMVIFGFSRDKPWSNYDIRYWVKLILHNQRVIRRGYPYDIAVVELGTDGPGQIAEFAYLKPDIGVITAIAPEHMAFFGSLDNVAKEELALASFAKRMLINADDIPQKYQELLTRPLRYGLHTWGEYKASFHPSTDLSGEKVTFNVYDRPYKAHLQYIGEQGVKAALCALAVADMLELDVKQAAHATQQLVPVAGRMQCLSGKKGSNIIDDTYNASPLAVRAALDVLYGVKTTTRVAILGSMNEFGPDSPAAHAEIGAYCDPKKLAAVVTVGTEANAYLAPVARQHGCVVKSFANPYEAGAWVERRLEPGTVVLVKGSQNGVFLEEAVKSLLADPQDADKLVRQSPSWLKRKRRQLPKKRHPFWGLAIATKRVFPL